jgi:hypothetical protein
VSVFPFEFDVPSPYDETNFVVKIIDSQNCEDGETITITPTPTSSVTPTNTRTPTRTPTQTRTPTKTPTMTSTMTQTPTMTTTQTPTPTQTPAVASHLTGQNRYVSSGSVCNDVMTILPYYTYISESNSTPIIGATVYETLVNTTLYNPYVGGNKYIKMKFGSDFYVVQINDDGEIISFEIC